MTTYRGRLVGQRRLHPAVRAVLYAVAAMILLAVAIAALIIVPGSDSSSSAHAADHAAVKAPARSMAPCRQSMAIIRDRLAQLGGNLADWSLTDDTRWYGTEIPTGTYTSRVEVSISVPCWVLPSTVNHEWMHQQQMLWFGNGPMHRRGDVEIMADCGSWLLGSEYTPYLDRARRTGAGCSRTEFAYAEAMIAHAGVPLVRHP